MNVAEEKKMTNQVFHRSSKETMKIIQTKQKWQRLLTNISLTYARLPARFFRN